MIKNEKMFDIKCIIFEVLHAYKNMSDENKIYELSTHISNDYVINLQNEKHFFYNFIYSLFETKSKKIEICFDKYLIKNFIRFFKSSIDVFFFFISKKNNNLR